MVHKGVALGHWFFLLGLFSAIFPGFSLFKRKPSSQSDSDKLGFYLLFGAGIFVIIISVLDAFLG